MERSGNFYKAIRLGYILISILIGCMAYNSLYEWQEIEALELGNKKILCPWLCFLCLDCCFQLVDLFFREQTKVIFRTFDYFIKLCHTLWKESPSSVSTGDQTFAYTARGFLILFAYWLSGSFVECEHDCLSCAHCMGAKLQFFNEITAFLFRFYCYLSLITDILPSETLKNDKSTCYFR